MQLLNHSFQLSHIKNHSIAVDDDMVNHSHYKSTKHRTRGGGSLDPALEEYSSKAAEGRLRTKGHNIPVGYSSIASGISPSKESLWAGAGNETLRSIQNTYKEFKISKDVKELQKWLDLKEIEKEKERYLATSSNSGHLSFSGLEDQQQAMLNKSSMFFSAFKELLKLVPDKMKDYQVLLQRVHDGLKESFSL